MVLGLSALPLIRDVVIFADAFFVYQRHVTLAFLGTAYGARYVLCGMVEVAIRTLFVSASAHRHAPLGLVDVLSVIVKVCND